MAPCWRSTQMLSQPCWVISSAETEEGMAHQPFTTLPPSAQIRRILFSRMMLPRCCRPGMAGLLGFRISGLQYQLRGALGDGDGRDVGIGAYDGRHGRGIDD